MAHHDQRLSSRPKWINPCGLGTNNDFGDSELVDFVPRLNDQELLDQIVVQAKNSLMHAQIFRERYVQDTFNLNFMQHHEAWKSNHYEWLPSTNQIPKSLGDPTPSDHLETLMLDTALMNTYEYLQKFAVGLEQVAWDQEDGNGRYKNDFQDMEFKLRATLCEIQMAMAERNVNQRTDISREIMDSEFRRMDNSSFRNLRDWLIFRDYMNGLEYVIQVFEYFKEKLTS